MDAPRKVIISILRSCVDKTRSANHQLADLTISQSAYDQAERIVQSLLFKERYYHLKVFTLLLSSCEGLSLDEGGEKVKAWQKGLKSLLRYLNNLLLAPNRPELKKIKVSTSYFHFQVKKHLNEAESFLNLVGYQRIPNSTDLSLHNFSLDNCYELVTDIIILHEDLNVVSFLISRVHKFSQTVDGGSLKFKHLMLARQYSKPDRMESLDFIMNGDASKYERGLYQHTPQHYETNYKEPPYQQQGSHYYNDQPSSNYYNQDDGRYYYLKQSSYDEEQDCYSDKGSYTQLDDQYRRDERYPNYNQGASNTYEYNRGDQYVADGRYDPRTTYDYNKGGYPDQYRADDPRTNSGYDYNKGGYPDQHRADYPRTNSGYDYNKGGYPDQYVVDGRYYDQTGCASDERRDSGFSGSNPVPSRSPAPSYNYQRHHSTPNSERSFDLSSSFSSVNMPPPMISNAEQMKQLMKKHNNAGVPRTTTPTNNTDVKTGQVESLPSFEEPTPFNYNSRRSSSTPSFRSSSSFEKAQYRKFGPSESPVHLSNNDEKTNFFIPEEIQEDEEQKRPSLPRQPNFDTSFDDGFQGYHGYQTTPPRSMNYVRSYNTPTYSQSDYRRGSAGNVLEYSSSDNRKRWNAYRQDSQTWGGERSEGEDIRKAIRQYSSQSSLDQTEVLPNSHYYGDPWAGTRNDKSGRGYNDVECSKCYKSYDRTNYSRCPNCGPSPPVALLSRGGTVQTDDCFNDTWRCDLCSNVNNFNDMSCAACHQQKK